jgi:ClpP class serine protease
MIPYHRVAQLVFNRPLFITPVAADAIGSYVLGRMRNGHGAVSSGDQAIEEVQVFSPSHSSDGGYILHSPRSSRFAGEYMRDPDTGKPSPYRITREGGVAILTIDGELVNRGAWVGASSGLVSYEGITYQIVSAMNDARVRSILLDINSPGGEAIGMVEVADAVRRASAVKPVVALTNGLSASAAYGIGSGATMRASIPSGVTGSVGTLMLHLDYSEALKDAGIKPTFIFAGAHKVDGNPYEPLPENVRAISRRRSTSSTRSSSQPSRAELVSATRRSARRKRELSQPKTRSRSGSSIRSRRSTK